MPKSIKEIKDFNVGTVLNVSEKDIPAEAPTFSLNINPMAEGGILDSIYNNKLTAVSNEDNIIHFERPVSWGETGATSGISTADYNASNIIVNNLKGFSNQAICPIKLVGSKGRQESLLAYSIEPWWELTKAASGAVTSAHNLMMTADADATSQDSIISIAKFGQASTTVTVTDGDAADGMTNGQYMTLVSNEGTEKHYILSDTNAGGPATGTKLVYKTATITDADCSGTTVTFTSEDHELVTGDIISVSGTTNFNDDNLADPQTVTVTATNTFTMVRSTSSSATDETGTWVLDPDIGSDTLSNLASAVTTNGVAVGLNLSTAIQHTFLVQLKAAIEHANGHNPATGAEITVSAVPASANGILSIKLTQATGGSGGNTIVAGGGTDAPNLTNVAVADNAFSGGADFEEYFSEGDYLSFVGTEDSSIHVNLAAGYAATGSSQAIVVGTEDAVANTHQDRVFVKSDGT